MVGRGASPGTGALTGPSELGDCGFGPCDTARRFPASDALRATGSG
ncbi:hypothetical protein PJP07_23325 [Mycobacterium kansasii]